MNEALFRRNAQACETAIGRKCCCACGGALHGRRHSEKWIRTTLRDVAELERKQQDQARAKLTVVELDAEFGTNNQAALDALQAFNSALRKTFGGGS